MSEPFSNENDSQNKALEKLVVELETKYTKGSDQREHKLEGFRTSPPTESRLRCTTHEAAIIGRGRGSQNGFMRSFAQSISWLPQDALKKKPYLYFLLSRSLKSQTRSPIATAFLQSRSSQLSSKTSRQPENL
jgi:hypothetical protein